MASTDDDNIDERFMALVDAIQAVPGPTLSPLGAGILAAIQLDIASDSRTFARLLGIEHALVLREVTELSGDDGVLEIEARDVRTQRTRYGTSQAGRMRIDAALNATR